MRLILALILVLVGVLAAIQGYSPGFAMAVVGVVLCPREDDLHKTTLAYRRGHTHGLGECSGFDCRL